MQPKFRCYMSGVKWKGTIVGCYTCSIQIMRDAIHTGCSRMQHKHDPCNEPSLLTALHCKCLVWCCLRRQAMSMCGIPDRMHRKCMIGVSAVRGIKECSCAAYLAA